MTDYNVLVVRLAQISAVNFPCYAVTRPLRCAALAFILSCAGPFGAKSWDVSYPTVRHIKEDEVIKFYVYTSLDINLATSLACCQVQ